MIAIEHNIITQQSCKTDNIGFLFNLSPLAIN